MAIRRAFRNMPRNSAELDRLFRNVDLPNDEVSLSQLQNIASDRLIGRDTAGIGDMEELTVGGGIEFSGSGGIQRSALTGDVTAAAGSNATTIPNDTVTYAKIQNVSATDRLLGRDTGGAGDIEELTLGGGIEFTGSGGLQRSALTGDVTSSAGSNTTTIPNDTVTYAKIQNVSVTDRVLGRSTAGAGDIEEIVCTAAGRALLDDASAADQRTTLGLADGTYTPTITAVTNIDSTAAYQCQYLRVGTVVHVSGRVDINATAAVATEIGISLPIASNLGAAEDLAGAAFCVEVQQGAGILADIANNRASLQYLANDTTSRAFYFTFTYQLL